MQQQQSAGGFEGFVGGEAVVGLGDGHAVDGEDEDAQQEGNGDVVVGFGGLDEDVVEQAEGDGGEGAAGGDGHEHFTPVAAVVGEPADGPLGGCAAEDGGGGEVGDVDVGEVEGFAVDWG